MVLEVRLNLVEVSIMIHIRVRTDAVVEEVEVVAVVLVEEAVVEVVLVVVEEVVVVISGSSCVFTVDGITENVENFVIG